MRIRWRVLLMDGKSIEYLASLELRSRFAWVKIGYAELRSADGRVKVKIRAWARIFAIEIKCSGFEEGFFRSRVFCQLIKCYQLVDVCDVALFDAY